MSSIITLENLSAKFSKHKSVSFHINNELVSVKVKNELAEAEVFLQGAQLTHYKKSNETALIWLSDECDYKKGLPLRGGIPICWPWFGDLGRNPERLKQQFSKAQIETLSAHGLVRAAEWELKKIYSDNNSETTLTFEYALSKNENKDWPFACRLQYDITVGSSLDIQLTIHNTGSENFIYSQALHTYFALENILETSIEGFDQDSYIDTLKNWQSLKQDGDIKFNAEVDRIYLSAPKPIVLKTLERNVTINNDNSNSTVIWNPWIEKSQRLSNFNDEAYKEMLCIETANIQDDIVSLPAGSSQQLSLFIS